MNSEAFFAPSATTQLRSINDRDELRTMEHLVDLLELADAGGDESARTPNRFDAIEATAVEIWRHYWSVVVKSAIADSRLDRFCTKHFSDAGISADMLLVPTLSVLDQLSVGISDLTAAARYTGLDGIIATTRPTDVMNVILNQPIGEYFAGAVRDFLREFRHYRFALDFAFPGLEDDEATLMAAIQEELLGGSDARSELQGAMTRGLVALNGARERLADRPDETRHEFENLVERARLMSHRLNEATYRLGSALTLMRQRLIEIGEILVQRGLLGRSDDIFFLTRDEIAAASSTSLDEEILGSFRVTTLEREFEWERAAITSQPPLCGAANSAEPGKDLVFQRIMKKISSGSRRRVHLERVTVAEQLEASV